MIRRSHARRRVAVAGLATAVAVIGVPSATALTATAAPVRGAERSSHALHALPAHRMTPTAAARGAGIARAGDAYMGWKNQHMAMTAKVRGGKLVVSALRASGHGAKPTSAGDMTRLATTVSPYTTVSNPVYGLDVSHYQGTVNWPGWYSQGKRFAYIKATEGTSYVDPAFSTNYTGSYRAGMIRGAYHFGLPSGASGATQADYFVAHGGGWSGDGKTLPGVLDIEYNPYGSTCYGKTPAQLVSWVSSFVKEYKYRTGRDAVIYTAYNFWVPCLGNSGTFAQTNPQWVASYSTTAPKTFGAWQYYTFHQYTDSPLDLDSFNGSYSRLQALAKG